MDRLKSQWDTGNGRRRDLTVGLQQDDFVDYGEVPRHFENRLASLEKTKRRIFEHVRTHPGQVIAAIADGIGCSHNNASRHLATLCGMGLLVREKEGRGVRHYCTFDHGLSLYVRTFMEDPKKRHVLEFIANHADQQWNVHQLACRTGVYHTFLLRLLNRLHDRGLVELQRPNARHYVRSTSRLVEVLRSILGEDPSADGAR